MMIFFHRFGAFGRPTKGLVFMMDAFKWAPGGLLAWLVSKDKRPGMVNLRNNRIYAREVATKLVEEKRRELENGTPRKDLLSLLGSPWVFFTRLDIGDNIRSLSQGKFRPAARMAIR
jgi:hypothetical protein